MKVLLPLALSLGITLLLLFGSLHPAVLATWDIRSQNPLLSTNGYYK